MPSRSLFVTELVVGGRTLELATGVLLVERDDGMPGLGGPRGWTMSAVLDTPVRELTPGAHAVEVVTADGKRRRGDAILTRIDGDSVEFRGSGVLNPPLGLLKDRPSVSERDDAWRELRGVTPRGWWVGLPSAHPERGEWVLYAYDQSERPVAGPLGQRLGRAVAASEVAVIRAMTERLREIRDGRVPK